VAALFGVSSAQEANTDPAAASFDHEIYLALLSTIVGSATLAPACLYNDPVKRTSFLNE